jgi:hypothetical protein
MTRSRCRAWRSSTAISPWPAARPAGRLANRSNLVGAAGRFLLSAGDAEVIFARVTDTVRASWHASMRRAGVSERHCAAIRSAFLYDGLFCEPSETDV